MELRGISKETVDTVLSSADEIIEQDELTVFQRIVKYENERYLVRVFVNS